MKGFEIAYNGKVTFAAIEDGLLMIHLSHLRDRGNLYVGGVDYENHIRIVWYDNIHINIGDMVDFRYIDINHVSKPVKYTREEGIMRPFSKMEMFLNLEQYLKSKGLL
jgi:hypothetical protein